MNSKSALNKYNTSNYKYCEFCGSPMPMSTKEPYCDRCRELALFHEVREYIRENDVTEFQVAAHFGIPLRKVKGWIQEGRIEYKETSVGKRALNNNFKCEICGAPVTFGTLCTKCLKQMNKEHIHGYDMSKPSPEDDRMFFLDQEHKNK